MSSSLTSLNIHYVFSTKNREKVIEPEIRERLWAVMGGIARNNNMVPHAIGGTDDHVHLLLTLPATISASKAIQLIKAGSSKWIKEEFREMKGFKWQKGYGAFSVNALNFDRIIHYIRNQEKRHQVKSYEVEYRSFLKASGVRFDEKYFLG